MDAMKNRLQGFFSQMVSRKGLVFGLPLLGIAGALTYYMWGEQEQERRYRGATVEVDYVRKGSIERHIDTVGTLSANESVVIKPQVTGTIKEIHFKGGESFGEDAPLVTIDDRVYQAQLKEAESRLELAKINYERKNRLFETQAGAKAKLDEAQSQLGVAEASVDLARLKLKHTVVRAPFDGVAGIRNISVGDVVNEQKDLLIFVDVNPMKIDFKLPSAFVQLLSIGQRVTVYVDGFQDQSFNADIEEIDARIEPQTHSLALRAKIPNDDGLLKPGLFGRVHLVAGSKDDVLLVPASAIEVTGDKEESVYRVVERSGYKVIEKATITTGIRNEETVEVVRGLNEDDIIVISGHVKIQDGSIVRPIGLRQEDKTSEKNDTGQGEDGAKADTGQGEDGVKEDTKEGVKKQETATKEETSKEENSEKSSSQPGSGGALSSGNQEPDKKSDKKSDEKSNQEANQESKESLNANHTKDPKEASETSQGENSEHHQKLQGVEKTHGGPPSDKQEGEAGPQDSHHKNANKDQGTHNEEVQNQVPPPSADSKEIEQKNHEDRGTSSSLTQRISSFFHKIIERIFKGKP